jgi:hypothetical protein
VDEACDLELGVVGRGGGEQRGALEAVGEDVDGLAVERVVAAGKAREQLVDGLGAQHAIHSARGGTQGGTAGQRGFTGRSPDRRSHTTLRSPPGAMLAASWFRFERRP